MVIKTLQAADPENLNLRKVRVSGEKNSLTNITNTKLSLYPNPTSDYIILQYDVVKDKKYSFEIRNMKGDILTRINNNTSGSEVISVKSFEPGLYIIFVISENKILDSAKFSVI